jgi:hypothetical protein
VPAPCANATRPIALRRAVISRQPPIATKAGKILPFHHPKRPSPRGLRPAVAGAIVSAEMATWNPLAAGA